MMKRMFDASSTVDDVGAWTAERTKKKRRSRWCDDANEKTFIPGMPTVIPAGMTKTQEEQYLVQLQIEEISRRLRTGDLGIPENPEARSPSPEPIYNNEGKRLNTRDYRTRKTLEEQRHTLVLRATELNDEYKPPIDYKPPIIRVNDKVMIPQDEHPDINFVGLLIGPRGNTLKNLEKETGAKIIIRGKGSVKEGKIGRKDGQPMPGEDEPLHAYITANNPENVKLAVDKIKDIIKQGIEVPEGQNDLRRQQLRELALLNGTLRENDALSKLKQLAEAQTIITNTIICTVCGGAGHLDQDCKQKRPGDSFRMAPTQTKAEKAKMDSEYMSLMAELGEGLPPPVGLNSSSHGHHAALRQVSSQPHGGRMFALPAPPPPATLMSQRPVWNPPRHHHHPHSNHHDPRGPAPPPPPPPILNTSTAPTANGRRPPLLLPPPMSLMQPPPPPTSLLGGVSGGVRAPPPRPVAPPSVSASQPWQQQQSSPATNAPTPPSLLSLPSSAPMPTSQQQQQQQQQQQTNAAAVVAAAAMLPWQQQTQQLLQLTQQVLAAAAQQQTQPQPPAQPQAQQTSTSFSLPPPIPPPPQPPQMSGLWPPTTGGVGSVPPPSSLASTAPWQQQPPRPPTTLPQMSFNLPPPPPPPK